MKRTFPKMIQQWLLLWIDCSRNKKKLSIWSILVKNKNRWNIVSLSSTSYLFSEFSNIKFVNKEIIFKCNKRIQHYFRIRLWWMNLHYCPTEQMNDQNYLMNFMSGNWNNHLAIDSFDICLMSRGRIMLMYRKSNHTR